MDDPGNRLGTADDERHYDVLGLQLDGSHHTSRWVHGFGLELRSLAADYDYASIVRFEPGYPAPDSTGATVARASSPTPSGEHIAAYVTSRMLVTERLAAELGLRSAHWARLPSVVLQGSWTPKSVSSQRFNVDVQTPIDSVQSTSAQSKGDFQGRVAVSLPIFAGFATVSRVAAARSQLIRATETRDALVRNLEDEVRQTLLGHQEAMEREALGRVRLSRQPVLVIRPPRS